MSNVKLHPGLADLVVTRYFGSRDQLRRFEGYSHAHFIGGHSYTGDFRDGLMHGVGVYEWSDGTRFSGTFHRNCICGFGTFTWPDGSVYIGKVLQGKRHGQGTLKGPNGFPRYEGSWRLGQRNGFGTLTYDAEETCQYQGNWVDDRRQGQGMMHYPSGNVYTGEWREGDKCGVGRMSWHKRHEYYEGSWHDGRQSGYGKHVWLDLQPGQRWSCTQRQTCNRFCGQWEGGVRHGIGTFFYANGARYNGAWVRGFKHGEGIFIQEHGRIYVGTFVHDHITKDDSQRENLEVENLKTTICLHIEDILGDENSAMTKEKKLLYKSILRVNSELKEIYQKYSVNDGRTGIFAMTLRQLHAFCVDTRMCPGSLPLALINNIVGSLRRQHAAVIETAVRRSAAIGLQRAALWEIARSASFSQFPSFDSESEPILYREFVEILVRISVTLSAAINPSMTVSHAFQDLLTNYINPTRKELPSGETLSSDGRVRAPHVQDLTSVVAVPPKAPSETISFQAALSILSSCSTIEDRTTSIETAFKALCKFAQLPSPDLPDIRALLLSSNMELTRCDVNSLLGDYPQTYTPDVREAFLHHLDVGNCDAPCSMPLVEIPPDSRVLLCRYHHQQIR